MLNTTSADKTSCGIAPPAAPRLHPGGEAPLDGPFPSLFIDQARDEGGLLLFIEHRYYGKSYPFGPKASYSNEGLRFLTVEQAMADFHAITLAIRKASVGGALHSTALSAMCQYQLHAGPACYAEWR